MTTELALPSTSNPEQWDEEARALMASAGLVHRDYDGTETIAPRSVVASFLYQCERSKLDPHARQIYLIARKNRGQLVWTTQVSIDGFRVIAERSGHYAGQGDSEWLTEDGKWVDVWLPKYGGHPVAARATVYRDDFATPMRAIAHWDSYVQTKSGGEVTSMWKQHGPLMIAKCAEALALRKAFPQDLSSLYTDDEMAQAENGTDGVPSVTRVPARRDSNPGAGNNRNRGHASETGVNDRPERDATPASDSRPRPSRTKAEPGAGRTDGPDRHVDAHDDQRAIADEWADRARKALTVTDARDLYRDANHRHLLDYPTSSGELLGDVLRARGEHLADEEAHAEETDEPLDIPADDYPNPVY